MKRGILLVSVMLVMILGGCSQQVRDQAGQAMTHEAQNAAKALREASSNGVSGVAIIQKRGGMKIGFWEGLTIEDPIEATIILQGHADGIGQNPVGDSFQADAASN